MNTYKMGSIFYIFKVKEYCSQKFYNYKNHICTNQNIESGRKYDEMEIYLIKISHHKIVLFSFDKKIFGFKNIGNTCYMNSALQVIMRNPFINLQDIVIKSNFYLKCETLDLFSQLIILPNQKNPDLYSNKILKKLKHIIGEYFNRYQNFNQEDSVEFYLNFIRIVLEENNLQLEPLQKSKCLKYRGAEYFYIIENFISNYEKRDDLSTYYMGIFLSELICEECNYVFIDFEQFLDIPLHTNYNNEKRINLQHILDNFFNPEMFESNITCRNCKTKSINRLNKSVLIYPKILTIILNRLDDNNIKDTREILNNRFNTFSLDLTKFDFNSGRLYNLQHEIKYHLYGTMNHFGTFRGGHYISHCYTDQGWVQFNDSSYQKVGITEVLNGATCLTLFKEIYLPYPYSL